MKRYLAYCKGDILLTTEGNIPFGNTPPIVFKPWNAVTTITVKGDECHIYNLDSPVLGVEGLQMMGLRKTFGLLSTDDYNLAGKCAEIIYWDHNSKFCGCCGAPMKWHTVISKHCTNCGKELWPQLATAIIVRVRRRSEGKDEILMVHANNFKGNYYGLVAGFVETGETLEQCVAREVMEETHLEIQNIRYFASQPWPYPCGLMVGFTADYVEGNIKLQREELGAGGWFSRNNLPEIPNRSSLARWLIDDWLNEVKQ